jgi:hypothetical protein
MLCDRRFGSIHQSQSDDDDRRALLGNHDDSNAPTRLEWGDCYFVRSIALIDTWTKETALETPIYKKKRIVLLRAPFYDCSFLWQFFQQFRSFAHYYLVSVQFLQSWTHWVVSVTDLVRPADPARCSYITKSYMRGIPYPTYSCLRL